jgi:DNA repair exonuclease SbcCD ATPase subunit
MIIFKTLRYQNLLSTGNQFTEVVLNRSKSTLVVGENGAGKSSFIEALTFALYGRPFRNINKPQLVNAITGKNLIVELEFSIGKKEYMIRRGIKPTVFEVYQSGTLINQNADIREYQDMLEKNILKLNFKSFSQIVVLGSANYVPFMQLAAQQRRGVVEDLLDIQIFSVMNSILKDKITANKSDLLDIDYKVTLCQQKIDMHQKHVDSMKANNDDLIAQKQIKIQEHEIDSSHVNLNIADLLAQAEILNAEISDETRISSRRSKLVQMEATIEDKIRKLKREVAFYHDHDNCPTCKQGIDHDFKSETIAKREAKTDELNDGLQKLESDIQAANQRINEISILNKQIQELNTKIQHNNQQITFYQRYIRDLNKEIAVLQEQSNKIETESEDTATYEQELIRNKKQKESLSKQKSLLDVAAHLLKDGGIKTKIIKQYVPVMNKLINKYLAAMDFFVDFQLDESFNETIKSRFRDDFSYASFSEGEKMRIDLSLMFTWRAIAKLRNSASTNLLIMDEVFDSSLDSGGTEEFLKILDSLTQDTNTFVISHKGDQLYDKFHSVIKFEKNKNFSRIAA